MNVGLLPNTQHGIVLSHSAVLSTIEIWSVGVVYGVSGLEYVVCGLLFLMQIDITE